MSKFTFIDLFAGIGGFKMALSANGGHCLGFSEINKDAVMTYCNNYNISPDLNFGDITKIRELPKHDILTAGVPCQSWSIAGKNLGFDDHRGQLWNDTISLLNQSKPKVFIFENVKGLVDPSIHQNELDTLVELAILKKVEYRFEIVDFEESRLNENEKKVLNLANGNFLIVGELKTERSLKVKRIPITDTLGKLIGNSVSVSVIAVLIRSILSTGVFSLSSETQKVRQKD